MTQLKKLDSKPQWVAGSLGLQEQQKNQMLEGDTCRRVPWPVPALRLWVAPGSVWPPGGCRTRPHTLSGMSGFAGTPQPGREQPWPRPLSRAGGNPHPHGRVRPSVCSHLSPLLGTQPCSPHKECKVSPRIIEKSEIF